MIMNSEVDQIIRRTYGYYFEDGLVELGLGILFIASGLLFLTWSTLQAASLQGAVLALVSILIVVGGVYGLRWAIGRIKERVSYPRSGYASYREGEPSIARWLRLVAYLSSALESGSVSGSSDISCSSSAGSPGNCGMPWEM